MAKATLGAIWMAVWVAAAIAASLRDVSVVLPGREFFKGLPEDEQPDFLTFELSRGYTEKFMEKKGNMLFRDEELVINFPDDLGIPDGLVQKFEALEVPQNFTENLYDLVKTEFNLDEPSIRTLILSRSVCLVNGVCIDLDDIGSLCCPF
ncbi:uncharacterized protein LOC107216951 [Neodiprion lecontei]|uniref:Uncharacterized protein LOC107216951 n=1 Tax=Neodiprion lecontei TaxID=441921 RepID=A0A6J0B825_NEOLC|nr:uncharacterized protein LOC107216951 [Neodiprion lecontei]